MPCTTPATTTVNAVAAAIQNSLRYEHELQRRERMSLIAGVSRLITAGLEPEELVATAAQVIHERLGYANVVIPLLHSGDPDYLLFRSHAGAYRDVFEKPYPLPITSGITGVLYWGWSLPTDLKKRLSFAIA